MRFVVCTSMLVLTTACHLAPTIEAARPSASRGPEPRRLEWRTRPDEATSPHETANERLLLHWTLPGEWVPSPAPPSTESVQESQDQDQVIFADDRRVLSSAHYGTQLSVVELPSGKRLGHIELRLGSDHFFLGHALSPDGTHVTVLERHGEDTDLDLLVWKVGERTVLRRAIPKTVCEGTCTVTWQSKTELSLVATEGAPTHEGRLDLASNVLRVMPVR